MSSASKRCTPLPMEWSSFATQLGVFILLTTLVVDIVRRLVRDNIKKKNPLPPGPTPLPLVGNVFSLHPKLPWLTYTEWRAKYGDIVHFRLLNSDAIVLNSISATTELLGKRAQIYSDRPHLPTAKPYGQDYNFALSHYGDHWRLCRRIFHQTFHAGASLAFRPMQLRRARQMIINIIDAPDEYSLHYSTFAAGVATSSVYDYEPKHRNDPIVSVFDKFLEISIPNVTLETAVLLTVFPFLLHIPDWFPGSRIKRDAREALEWRDKAIEMSYKVVRKHMEAQENVNHSMVFDHIMRMQNLNEYSRAEYELALKHASTTAIIGSVETTSTTVMIFTLAMIKNSRVWKRAQADIDTIVGTNRLPEFEDRQSLPYVDAIIRETFRWKPFLPLGVPHATTESDIYNGFYIPKGATVIVNVWGMLQDETRYPNSDEFRPERFFDAQGLLTDDNPAELLFGFGRRLCPGRHIGDASIWSAIATMLATLEFRTTKDEDGRNVGFEAEFTGGLTHRPVKFPCCLTPRPHITKEVLERVLLH